jgi:hypothetical protein
MSSLATGSLMSSLAAVSLMSGLATGSLISDLAAGSLMSGLASEYGYKKYEQLLKLTVTYTSTSEYKLIQVNTSEM